MSGALETARSVGTVRCSDKHSDNSGVIWPGGLQSAPRSRLHGDLGVGAHGWSARCGWRTGATPGTDRRHTLTSSTRRMLVPSLLLSQPMSFRLPGT